MAARHRLLTFLLLSLLMQPLAAQAPPKQEPAKKEPAGVLFGKEGAPVAAAAMIGQGSPLVSVLVLHHGAAIDGYWVLMPAAAERLSAEAEKHMFKDVRDRTDRNARDHFARDYLITLARRVKPADLAKAADPSITYVHLWGQSNEFRGAVVPLKGTLRLVRRFDAPLSLKNDPDIKFLYEGWIYDQLDPTGRNPYCVLFTELPKGIEPGSKLDYQVHCNAYYFKLLKYEAGDGTWHLAPMLVARSVDLLDGQAAVEEANIFRDVMLPVIVSSTFAVILIGMGLLLFFRRGDKAVNARLRQTRDAQFVVPAPDQPADPAASEAIKPEKSEI